MALRSPLKIEESPTINNEERCQLDMPCSPSPKEQVPSAKPSDLSMTIPYVPFSYDSDSHFMFLIKRTILLILQKGKLLLIIQRWILVFRSTLILRCRISSCCLHLSMEHQLVVPPSLLGLFLLLSQEIPRWTSTSGV